MLMLFMLISFNKRYDAKDEETFYTVSVAKT